MFLNWFSAGKGSFVSTKAHVKIGFTSDSQLQKQQSLEGEVRHILGLPVMKVECCNIGTI